MFQLGIINTAPHLLLEGFVKSLFKSFPTVLAIWQVDDKRRQALTVHSHIMVHHELWYMTNIQQVLECQS
jgi:hypothetical protein